MAYVDWVFGVLGERTGLIFGLVAALGTIGLAMVHRIRYDNSARLSYLASYGYIVVACDDIAHDIAPGGITFDGAAIRLVTSTPAARRRHNRDVISGRRANSVNLVFGASLKDRGSITGCLL